MFVLLHSLLLGPRTWAPVAARLPGAVVPSLLGLDPPLWPAVVDRVGAALDRLPPAEPVHLVAHSNAGLLVPPIVAASPRPIAGCVFVETRLPSLTGPSPTRQSALPVEPVDGRLPPWTTWWTDSGPLFPDPETRAAVEAEQPRLPVTYYDQQIPVPPGWDHRPCAYLWFSEAYGRAAAQAQARGWPVTHVPGLHLHQLVDPDAVAAAIRTLARTG
ncbi:alpha/beta hydrolase [Actinoplanes sp. NPDC020271]|uniref:alpha/beta hydrolase n=1 Tax=Actinoplanes sp. NPDC020271 TaxID=3363896 RepID=UPI0037AE572D